MDLLSTLKLKSAVHETPQRHADEALGEVYPFIVPCLGLTKLGASGTLLELYCFL